MAKQKLQSETTKEDRDTSKKWRVDGEWHQDLMFRYNRAVRMSVAKRHTENRTLVSQRTDSSWNVQASRVSKNKERVLDRSIHIHRMWFQFLKLALELEELGVELTLAGPSRSKRGGGMAGSEIHIPRKMWKVKVDRKKYEDWDLDDVLTLTFDKWWKTHSHLFEGYAPAVVSKSEVIDSDNLFYICVDRRSSITDAQSLVADVVSKEMKKKGGKGKFEIRGRSRVPVLQNEYNAIVLTLQGWTSQEICEHKDVYLRVTDDIGSAKRTLDVDTNDPSTWRLKPTTSDGKVQYSLLVNTQKKGGLWHIYEAANGVFGNAVPQKRDWEEYI